MSVDLLFLPRPQRIEYHGDSTAATDVHTRMVSDLPPQGYRLQITPEHIRIDGADPAGLFYGHMTLRQVRRLYPNDNLPGLTIEDWPDLPVRGIQLDISRNKVPRMETLYALVDRLAEWKINQLQLYTEHTFAYANHREVWDGADPMTAEEIRALDTYCRERFIDLVPNQNSFGHLKPWLIHPRYRDLAEAPDGCDTIWGRQDGPFSLCPLNPGSLALMQELYAELLPNFSSRYFNIGCDETVDLGRGKSREACEARGAGRVYLEFLLKLFRAVDAHDRTPLFWADIINHHPELIPELPKRIIALEWGYEANHPFLEHTARFAEQSIPFYVCPGTSSWNALAGRTDNALANLLAAAVAARRHGARGYLITDWGDRGHWQPQPISYPAFAYGAAVAWGLEANREIPLARVLDMHLFEDPSGTLGAAALDMGNLYRYFDPAFFNGTVPFYLLYAPTEPMGQPGTRLASATRETLLKAQTALNELFIRIESATPACAEGPLIVRELNLAGHLLAHAFQLSLARWEQTPQTVPQALPSSKKQILAEHLQQVLNEYNAIWQLRNREGERAKSVDPLVRLLRAYQ